MRKFHQLILIIISTISVSLLLVYRHEYNRLRYVLEVFNFFGQAPKCLNLPEFLNSTTTIQQHDWGPVPVWQSIENALVYSAFLKPGNDVETLIVHGDDQVPIKSCYLWFRDKSVIGNMKFTKLKTLSSSPNLALFKYYCRADTVVPYAVSFTNKNKRTKQLSKIMVQPLSKRISNVTTACVIPSETYTKASVIEFLSYYKIVGVNTFIIYNNNVPHTLVHMLEKLSIKLGIEIVTFPWNFPNPVQPTTRSIIEQDCLLRTKGKSRNILVLDWTEYIVPKYHHNLPAIFDHYDPANRIKQFNLQTLVFCTDNHEDHQDPAVLHSVFYDSAKSVETLRIYRDNEQNNDVINTQDVTLSIAAVHRYIACTTHPAHSKKNDVMLRFSLDLRKSTLYKLFKMNTL